MLSKINIKSEFFKSVLILSSGTVLAQLVSLIAIPIVSRYFGPEENAYLGLFLKVSTLCATLYTARLELVFPSERNINYAFGIYQFAFRLCLFLCLFTFSVIAIYALFSSKPLEEKIFLLSIPFGIFVISLFNLGNSWDLRAENFKGISKASLLLSIFSNLFKIGGGIFTGHFLVLIFSTILGYLLASVTFLRQFLDQFNNRVLKHNSKRTKVLIKRNKNFYTYNLYHVILDLSRDMILASFFWIYFSKENFGSYEFSLRMMKLPIIIIATSMSQVFYRKAQDFISQDNQLRKLTFKTLFYSILIAILPFGIIYFFGSELFSFVFGGEWKESGKIASFLSPWLFITFIFTPISFLPIILNKQKEYFKLNILFLPMILILIILIPYFHLDFYQSIILLTIFQGTFIVMCLSWFLYLIKSNRIIEIS